MVHSANKTTSNKQLLVITPYFYPHLGGVEKHVLKTNQLLKQQGWSIDIITQQHESRLPVKEQVQGLIVHRFRFPQVKFLGLLFIWWQLLTKYWSLFAKAEVIHVHDVMIWVLPLRLLLPSKNWVLTMHGWEGVYPIPKKNVWLKRLSARLATKVVLVGEYIGQYYGVKSDLVIYGGVDEADILTEAEVKQKQQLKAGQKLRLVYVGRLAEDTGLRLLLQAWSKLSTRVKIKLEIIFVGDGELRFECEQIGKVLGWADEDRVKQELHQAQICWASGYLSALEAMAAGCLVMAGAKNELKQDYWSELEAYVHLLSAESQFKFYLEQVINQPQISFNQIKVNLKFVNQRGWRRLVAAYQALYF